MSYSGKVVLVTGGGSGIGAATALAYAREGAKVAIVGRNEAKLTKFAASFVGLTEPLVLRADISDETQTATLVQRTVDHFGQLDILINNAGTSQNASILEGNLLEAYNKVMDTNLKATIHLTMLAAPYLIKTKGNIINVSSVAGCTTIPMNVLMVYSVSKAAINHFTKTSALELAPHGVRVNSVSPGPVRTDLLDSTGFPFTWDDFQKFTALDRVAESKEIADLILFLTSDKAKSITGANFVSDNGLLLKA